MRKILGWMLVGGVALLLAACGGSPSGSETDTNWTKGFGTAGTNTNYDVVTDSSRNVFVTGSFTGATLTIGGTTLNRVGSTDAYVAKLTKYGIPIWAKSFGGGSATMNGRSIGVDSSGNVYVAGNFTGGNLSAPALTLSGTSNYFLMKLDANGNVLWSMNFGPGSAADLNRALHVDSAGNAYLVGSLTTNWATPSLTKIGTSDAFIVKVNTSGSVVWAKNFGGAGGNARAWKVTADGAGNLYTAGSFDTAALTTPALALAGGAADAFVMKLDSAGNATWARAYGGAGASVTPGGVAVDGSGNVYAGFHFSGANLTAPAITKLGSQDALLLKVDASGTTTWSRSYGNTGASLSLAGVTLADSTVHLFGTLGGADLGTPALTRYGTVDAIHLQLDTAGTVTTTHHYGGAGASFDTATTGTVNAASSLVLAGSFSGANLSTPALNLVASRDIVVRQERQ